MNTKVENKTLKEGDRVYSFDYDKDLKPSRYYGTLHKNTDYPHVSEWYIAYDDGHDCAVLDMSLVFKVSSLPLTMTEILAEAERRYPEHISVEGRDSDKKQRKNQRLFIEGARWMQAVWLAIEQ